MTCNLDNIHCLANAYPALVWVLIIVLILGGYYAHSKS
jgi:hypothetical protein